jgi:hypothetical protein
MFGLILGLPIELENERGVSTNLDQSGVDILMTRHARVGPGIQIAQIPHPGRDAIGMSVIGSRVAA